MIVSIMKVSLGIVLLYAMLKDMYNMDNQEEVYRVEYKEFMDEETYFKVKYEEEYLKNNN